MHGVKIMYIGQLFSEVYISCPRQCCGIRGFWERKRDVLGVIAQKSKKKL